MKAVELRRLGFFRGRILTAVRGDDMTSVEQGDSSTWKAWLNECDLFLPVSDDFRKRLIELGCEARKVVTLRSAIDLKAIRQAMGQSMAQDKSGNRSFRLVTVGRLVEKKGIQFALQAVARLKSRYDIRYDIIGDGALRSELEQLASNLGIEDETRFHGWLPHGQALRSIANCDVFLLPSCTSSNGRQEGIPNAVKEAMAMGIAVVSTSHSGIPELVEHGVSGLLVGERDSIGLADGIASLFASATVRLRLGQAAKDHVTRTYDSQLLGQELRELYARALA